MRVIAYLLYGEKKEYQLEVFFSILSALRLLGEHRDEVTISIISDRDDFDPNLPIDFIPLSKAELAEWTQQGRYNHRAKLFALQKLLAHYQSPVVLIDTDTYFLRNPIHLFERISAQRTVMHHLEYEYVINEQREWHTLAEKLDDGIEIDSIYLSRYSPMFNSGVIGVDVRHQGLLTKAIHILDQLYAASPVFNVEQFAVGAVLDQSTELAEASDIVRHYYGFSRDFIHVYIARLFPDFTAATLKTLLDSDLKPLSPDQELPYRPMLPRLLSRWQGLFKQWNVVYRFAYLAYHCAFAYAAKDAKYAAVWAKIALQALRFALAHCNLPQQQSLLANIQSDFRRFQPDTITMLPWLDSKTKRAWIQFWQQAQESEEKLYLEITATL